MLGLDRTLVSGVQKTLLVCRRGQEAQLAALLLVRAVGDEAVQVYIKAEVAAQALLGP